MFSVDNFYTVFNSYYGCPKKFNEIYYFRTHGSKDWSDIVTWGDATKAYSVPQHFTMGSFLMHDQEPLDLSNTNNFFKDANISSSNYYNVWAERFKELNYDISVIEFVSLFMRTIKVPIICHSEKNSPDIRCLEDNHWLSCYYWWHGMIAKDWFRHWERNDDLQVRNKSNETYRFIIYSRAFTGTRRYRETVIRHLEKFRSLVNYNWNNDPKCATLSATIDVTDANNSAIHLVAETLFDTEKIYLTEKVFKPMVMCQPFILFAPPGSLQYLRDYGFKTFSNVWPEDYDLITDSSQRKQAIFNLVDSLAAMPTAQFNKLYDELLPVVEYNRKHFYSTEFQDILWNELQKNCSDALLKQQELSEQLPGGNWMFYVNQVFERNRNYPERWHTNLDYFVKNNYISVEDFKSTYPKLFEHYQCQQYSLDNKS